MAAPGFAAAGLGPRGASAGDPVLGRYIYGGGDRRVFFRSKTMAGAGRMLGGLFGVSPDGSNYVSSGILRVMDLPILVDADQLWLIGSGVVATAFVVALGLPNVPQILGYREYRRAPERGICARWWPNAAWAIFTALALSISAFGMWQRLEFLYFQF